MFEEKSAKKNTKILPPIIVGEDEKRSKLRRSMTMNSLKTTTTEIKSRNMPNKTKSFLLEDGTKFVIPLRTARLKQHGCYQNNCANNADLKTCQLKTLHNNDCGLKMQSGNSISNVKQTSLILAREMFADRRTAKLKYTHCPSVNVPEDRINNSLPSFYQQNKRESSDRSVSVGFKTDKNYSVRLDSTCLQAAAPKQRGQSSRLTSLLHESAYRNISHNHSNKLPNISEDDSQ